MRDTAHSSNLRRGMGIVARKMIRSRPAPLPFKLRVTTPFCASITSAFVEALLVMDFLGQPASHYGLE